MRGQERAPRPPPPPPPTRWHCCVVLVAALLVIAALALGRQIEVSAQGIRPAADERATNQDAPAPAANQASNHEHQSGDNGRPPAEHEPERENHLKQQQQQQPADNQSSALLEPDIFEAIERGQFRHSTIVSVILTVAYTIVFVIGIVGNSFVVCIVCKSPRMRTVTNYFIVNLALADILVLLFCLPATLIGNLFIRKYLGQSDTREALTAAILRVPRAQN